MEIHGIPPEETHHQPQFCSKLTPERVVVARAG